MKKEYLNPKDLSKPGAYTHAVSVAGAAKLVYVSGQVSYGADGSIVGKGDMRAQSEQVFKNLTNALKAAGAAWGDVVKLNGYMVDMNADAVVATLSRGPLALPQGGAVPGQHARRRDAPRAGRVAARSGSRRRRR